MRTASTISLLFTGTCLIGPTLTLATSEAKHPDRTTLTEMVRDAELSRAAQVKSKSGTGRMTFHELFLLGGFQDGVFFMVPLAVDPRRLETLIDNFPYWDSAARGYLLIMFARLEKGVTPIYAEGTTAETPELRKYEEKARARILTLVKAKGYEKDWHPFVQRYKKCEARAASQLRQYLATHPKADSQEVSTKVIDPIATEEGLRDAVETTRIEPVDVADEMLRLVREVMHSQGLPEDDAALRPDQLLYACETRGRGTVNILSWHPLAGAMFAALAAGSDDSEAVILRRDFQRLNDEFAAWADSNRHADTKTRADKIRELAARTDLFTRIGAYTPGKKSAPEPSASSRPDQNRTP